MRALLFLLGITVLLPSTLRAVDLRCQGDLMTPGTIMAKVVAKCGPPLTERDVGEVSYLNERRRELRKFTVTELTYAVPGGFYVLTFEGGILKKSEYVSQ
ncbi:MAG: hypothetical protein JG774_514 [Desulfomicrobiaceae bacterium]|nr:hypothetical protein [Desulfomicrobiaceae bacterium]MBZ4684769.1 hypothetical protein [Desulfomicrobiaceae bacterium]MDI3492652.1 hypothetical protein [Desulfomicrobiaceae bacterium]MDK2872438.1 hypothetical protein [Desulfomicrobiaceae bacterium]